MLSVWVWRHGVINVYWYGNAQRQTGDDFAAEVKGVYTQMRKRGQIPANGLLLLCDNARSHRARVVEEQMKKLSRIQMLPHPPYTPVPLRQLRPKTTRRRVTM